MAETIVGEGRVKCRGTIKKGGLSGKECRRAILVKDPELGWGVPCDRCQELHPLRKILRDLVESGELDEKEVLAAILSRKEKEDKKVLDKTLERFKKIIKQALKDDDNVVELTMVGKNHFGYGTYIFTAENLPKIKDNIVSFDRFGHLQYVPLEKVECIEVRKKIKDVKMADDKLTVVLKKIGAIPEKSVEEIKKSKKSK